MPSWENVMSCDSVPSPGRVGRSSSPALAGAAGLEMSKISIAGATEVIRSEFEL